jgi:hypothetical protein
VAYHWPRGKEKEKEKMDLTAIDLASAYAPYDATAKPPQPVAAPSGATAPSQDFTGSVLSTNREKAVHPTKEKDGAGWLVVGACLKLTNGKITGK